MALCCSTGIPLAGWNLVLQFLILCGVQHQTQCSRCCLLSATQMATIPVWTFFNVCHHKDALLTYIQLVVQKESVSLFTKQLFSILSQVLNFVYLPVLQLEFQSIGHPHVREYSNPSPWLLMKILPLLLTAMDTTGKSATCNCKFTLWTADTTLWPP